MYNIGCKVNFAETAQISENFSKLGYEVVDFGEKADIVFINTCTVTHKADADCRKMIRRAIRQNPSSFIAVGGCYAQLYPETISKIEGVDAILGTSEKFRIPELITDPRKQESPLVFISGDNDREFNPACSADSNIRMRAVLKLQDGCDYFCSYCSVPYARGRSRSMPFEEIIPSLKSIEAQNYNEVVLTGINLGNYKAPSGETFSDVLKAIDNSQTNLRVRISSLEPNLVNDDIIDIVAGSDNICSHFHIPLQSGSGEILKKMYRRYDPQYFRDLVRKINKRIPYCGIGIDVIVGFPGETDHHFKETTDLLEDLDFSYLHVFSYSDRKIAKASTFEGKVDPKTKKQRTMALRKLSDKKSHEFAERQLGYIKKTIPEIFVSKTGLWKGWTENYIQVYFPGEKYLPAKEYKIELQKFYNDGVLSKIMI